MAIKLFRYISSGATPYYSLGLLLLLLAYLLTLATQDSSSLNDLFLLILGLGFASLILLIALLARNLFHLYRDVKNKEAGSRLTIRLVSMFALLILVSTSVVYSFSIHFLHRGIDSWFDVQVEQALEDSLELSRTSYGIRMRTLLRQTRMMAGVLSEVPEEDLAHSVRELRQLSGAVDLSLWSMDGQLITTSIESPDIILPNRPSESILRQLAQKQDYIGLDPGEENLRLRAVVLLPNKKVGHETQLLQVIFSVNEHLSSLGRTVQEAYTDYKELNYLRKPLISIFTLTLSLIVLLTLLASIWFAIWIARRIVHPLQELAAGTQAVASGNYDTKLSTAGHDEISFLVRSFNQMVQRLTQARHASQHSLQQLEQQTQYLSAVLGSLSSGVITLDNHFRLRSANAASSKILKLDLTEHLESFLSSLNNTSSRLSPFTDLVREQVSLQNDWQQQIEINRKKGLQTLMCRGTRLPEDAGWVIVFDDVTTLLQAQRNAAWGEVAKRLAHEIKNPLTPIQLSAERLQYKYEPLLPADQTGTLTKLTSTIVKQVEAMKDMVNDFSDYARNAGLQLQSVAIYPLLREIITLYQSNPNHKILLPKPSDDIYVKIDSNRFRQVLHNLLKNAIEACEEANMAVEITLQHQAVHIEGLRWLEISVHDLGPGIPDDMLNTLFEPYATNKTKGTGLGLAIVKKIIEEHHGHVWAQNNSTQGACIIIRLPLEE
ncbi:MAG: two-component sensor histidine kinase [Gammaproteobacteria bacterium]|nr:MAG: two-component sensor histidine kinase [Gammaproteobacteria bacterium]